jgi:cullin 1
LLRRQACKEFVNRNKVCISGSSRSPELLARYADSLLKKGPKALDDDELERTLTDIVLFLFISLTYYR